VSIFYAALIAFGSTYALWIFYLAVMSLARAKADKKLTKTALVLGYPILVVGYVLDAFVNIAVMTFLFLELPKELTVTSRLKRHNKDSVGWRKERAVWAEPFLDPFDPSGKHI
tara:strand:+ start:2208 stop:2546 length:339 start_codon:yes stop_codon:yes gene_type:complete